MSPTNDAATAVAKLYSIKLNCSADDGAGFFYRTHLLGDADDECECATTAAGAAATAAADAVVAVAVAVAVGATDARVRPDFAARV